MTGSVVMTEGFDMYNGTGTNTGVQAKWAYTAGGAFGTYAMTSGRFGGQGLSISAVAGTVVTMSRPLPGNYSTFALGFAFKLLASITGDSSLQPLLYLSGGGGVQASLSINSSGQIFFQRGTSTQVGGISPNNTILTNTWHYIGLEVSISSSAGTVNIYVDGNEVVSSTGLNTQGNTGSAGVDTIGLSSACSGASTSGASLFDDVYFVGGAATWLGEMRVETLRPASNFSVSWSPSSGSSNFAMVNDSYVDGDSSYVQSSTVGQQDLYGITPMSSTPSVVAAVTVVVFADKTDAATRSIYNSVVSGATEHDGTQQFLSGNYNRYDTILATDPNTSAAWTAAGVNALLIGPKVAS